MEPPAAVPDGKKGQLDGEDLEGVEDQSEVSGAQGHKFENLIKSMMARLELYNSLAPIQEYGRH